MLSGGGVLVVVPATGSAATHRSLVFNLATGSAGFLTGTLSASPDGSLITRCFPRGRSLHFDVASGVALAAALKAGLSSEPPEDKTKKKDSGKKKGKSKGKESGDDGDVEEHDPSLVAGGGGLFGGDDDAPAARYETEEAELDFEEPAAPAPAAGRSQADDALESEMAKTALPFPGPEQVRGLLLCIVSHRLAVDREVLCVDRFCVPLWQTTQGPFWHGNGRRLLLDIYEQSVRVSSSP